MRIEQINKAALLPVTKNELYALRLRCMQLWSKHYAKGSCLPTTDGGTMTREQFLDKYQLIAKSMRARELMYRPSDLDRALFKRAMTGVDVTAFEDLVVLPDAVSIVGASVTDPKSETLSVAVSKSVENPQWVETIGRHLADQIGSNRQVVLESLPTKVGSSFMPAFDLVLRPKQTVVCKRISQRLFVDDDETEIKKGGLVEGIEGADGVGKLWLCLPSSERESFEKVKDEALKVGSNLNKLKMLLKGALQNHACHLHMSLQRNCMPEEVDGGQLLASLDDLPLVKGLIANEQELDFNWQPVCKTKEFEATYEPSLILSEFSFKVVKAADKVKTLLLANTHNQLLGDGKFDIAYVPTAKGKGWVLTGSRAEEKKFEKFVPIFCFDKQKDESKDERIVCGIVYAPDEEDTQGDGASAEEIRKAAYYFMENVQRFKVNHKGTSVKVKVLESYLAPTDLEFSGQIVKQGTWLLTTRVLDSKIWKGIKSGAITGYSMAGYATVDSL